MQILGFVILGLFLFAVLTVLGVAMFVPDGAVITVRVALRALLRAVYWVGGALLVLGLLSFGAAAATGVWG